MLAKLRRGHRLTNCIHVSAHCLGLSQPTADRLLLRDPQEVGVDLIVCIVKELR